jgi:redox-sensitive bicupin YhaK (pirin superfamily)
MVHATLTAGAEESLPWPADFNALAYVMSGQGNVGPDGHAVKSGDLTVFGAGDSITLRAAAHGESRTPDLDVILLGGKPIREPIAWGGPFVMNTKQEVLQAFEDFQAGRLGQIPTETKF